jgi:hypothetical protein
LQSVVYRKTIWKLFLTAGGCRWPAGFFFKESPCVGTIHRCHLCHASACSQVFFWTKRIISPMFRQP